MQRRELIKLATGSAILPLLRPLEGWGSYPVKRVRPSDPGWPSEAEWEYLRRQVGGNLVRPQPLLAECVIDAKSKECAAVLDHLKNPYYIGDQPSGTQISGWLGAWKPEPSAYAVAAHSANDIVAAVRFASKHNLRLVVKGGGHSYQGTSNSADSLLIWTRPMNQIVHHDAFVPQGCESVLAPIPAVTVEAGALWMDVYDAVTTKRGRYIQGGGCATVGVAGLIQSGGFGSFSKRFGTAAGSLLEAEIVTADGALRTINERVDPELFWALKGGGGGSFGVVTKLTLVTHDLPEFFGWAEGSITANSDSEFQRLLTKFIEFYSQSLFGPHWGESVHVGKDNSLKLSMVCQGLDPASAREIWAPFITWLQASPASFKLTTELNVGSAPARGWWDIQGRLLHSPSSIIMDNRTNSSSTHAWWTNDKEQVGAYMYGYDSLWLPASLLNRSHQPALVDALFSASRKFGVALHFNKGLAGAPPDAINRARNTATNPAALNAFALAIIATGGPSRYPGLPEVTHDAGQAKEESKSIDSAAAVLRALVPKAGSYLSESNFFNSNWKEAFWGSNISRLELAKSRFDPDCLFFVHHGVGSDQWSPDGFTRLP
jgi:hypothetical protein